MERRCAEHLPLFEDRGVAPEPGYDPCHRVGVLLLLQARWVRAAGQVCRVFRNMIDKVSDKDKVSMARFVMMCLAPQRLHDGFQDHIYASCVSSLLSHNSLHPLQNISVHLYGCNDPATDADQAR